MFHNCHSFVKFLEIIYENVHYLVCFISPVQPWKETSAIKMLMKKSESVTVFRVSTVGNNQENRRISGNSTFCQAIFQNCFSIHYICLLF